MTRLTFATGLSVLAAGTSVSANDCTWDEHPAVQQAAINGLLSPFFGGPHAPTGFWKPVRLGGLMVTSTGWDCDAAPDVFEYPGKNIFGGDKATIGADKPGVVLIQPLVTVVLDELNIDSASGVIIAEGSSIIFSGSELNNGGFIDVGLDGSLAASLRIGSTTSLIGGGTVNIAGGLATINGSGTLTNVDNEISGAGLISVALINESSITADQGTLHLTNVEGNAGTLKSDGGTLSIEGGVIDNTGGTIEATAAGSTFLRDVTIAGGTLKGNGVGNLVTADPTILDGAGKSGKGGGPVTIEGDFTVQSPTAVIGSINNTGTIHVPGTLAIDHHGGGPTLNGGGTVAMAGGFISEVVLLPAPGDPPTPPSPRLTNVDNTINGAGSINVLFTNMGTVDANQSGGTLTINARNVADGVINNGLFDASNGGTLRLAGGQFSNSGGQIKATSGTLAVQDGARVIGGTVEVAEAGTLFMKTNAEISEGTVTVDGNLHAEAGISRLRGDVSINGTSTIGDGATLVFGDYFEDLGISTYSNTGDMTLGEGGGSAILSFASEVNLSGGGTIHLSDFSGFSNRLSAAFTLPGAEPVSARLINEDHRIHGAGIILVELTNRHIVEADGAQALTVIASGKFDDADPLINEGMLKSSGGSTLILKDGKVDNTSGMIEAGAGSRVELSSLDIVGGSLSAAAGGVIDALFDVTLDGVGMTLNGTFVSSGQTTLIGDITNNGDIELPNTGRLLISNLGGGVKLDGGGNINMAGGLITFLGGETPPGTLTNVDNTIKGSGRIALGLTNQGTIDADQAASLVIESGAGARAFINQGMLKSSGSGRLQLRLGEFDNSAGMIIASAGTLEIRDTASVTGGDVQIDSGAKLELTNNVELSGGTVTLDGDLDVVSGIANFLSGDVTASGNTTIFDATTLIFDENGSYSNSGIITIGETGGSAGLDIAGDVHLSGGGEVHLAEFSGLANRISDAQIGPGGNAVAARLFNDDHRIHGAGQIDVELTNNSTIEADGSKSLVITANGAVEDAKKLVNAGTLKASGGSTLVLQNGKIENSAGLIEAGAGSRVELSSLEIQGGVLTAAENGVIDALANVTLDGIGTILNGTFISSGFTTLIGDITNNGDIELPASGRLLISNQGGGVVLDGGGNVNLDGGFITSLAGESPSGTLTNTDNTLKGAGRIAVGLTNQGTIDADGAGTLTVDAGTELNAVFNQGTLKSSSSGKLQLRFGEFDNAGGMVLAGAGTVEIRDTASVSGGTVQVNGGAEIKLATNGVLTGGMINNAGIIRSVAGGLNNRLSGVVNNNDQIIIDNSARLTIDENGTYNNSGTIKLNSAGGTTVLTIDGSVTINGGDIELSDNVNNRIAAGFGAGPNRLSLLGTSLSGAGLVSVDLTNTGNISANGANALTLSGGSITNSGFIMSSGGALIISGSTVQNAGGVIDGAQIKNANIMGGEIGSAGIAGISEFNGLDVLGTVTITPGNTLRLSGAIDNQGEIRLDAIGPSANATLQIDGTALLSGGGDVLLGDSSNNRIRNVGTARLVNTDNTISGSGVLQFIGVENGGLIEAKGLNGLTISPAGGVLGGVINTGTLKASAASTLRLNGGLIENAGGTIRADVDGMVELNNNVTIVGGTLGGAGAINANSDVKLDGAGIGASIINGGNYTVLDGKSTQLSGTLVNNGSFTLASSEQLAPFVPRTELLLDGDAVLNGGGIISLSDFSANRIASVIGQFNMLTNNGNTIAGSGQFGDNVTGIINRGEIRGEGDSALVIDVRDNLGFLNDVDGKLVAVESGGVELAAGEFENRGMVLVAEDSTLTRDGDFSQSGGSTIVDGTLTVSDGIFIEGGSLGGSGTIIGDVTNTATIAPGNSPGRLLIDGDLNQHGVLEIEIGGPADSELFDTLIVTGELTLGGTLIVSLLDGFVPEVGARYDILQAASFSGTFANTIVFGPATFDLTFDSTNGSLLVTSAVPIPATLPLFISSLLGASFLGRRRRKPAAPTKQNA